MRIASKIKDWRYEIVIMAGVICALFLVGLGKSNYRLNDDPLLLGVGVALLSFVWFLGGLAIYRGRIRITRLFLDADDSKYYDMDRRTKDFGKSEMIAAFGVLVAGEFVIMFAPPEMVVIALISIVTVLVVVTTLMCRRSKYLKDPKVRPS